MKNITEKEKILDKCVMKSLKRIIDYYDNRDKMYEELLEENDKLKIKIDELEKGLQAVNEYNQTLQDELYEVRNNTKIEHKPKKKKKKYIYEEIDEERWSDDF